MEEWHVVGSRGSRRSPLDIKRDIIERELNKKPSFCPICGGLVDFGSTMMLGLFHNGYTLESLKPSHAYYYKGHKVLFCDDCVAGCGGVDIICRVIEASAETRAQIESDCRSVLDERRLKKRVKALLWALGIGLLALVIWALD